jgi:probable addiction module antidote protein
VHRVICSRQCCLTTLQFPPVNYRLQRITNVKSRTAARKMKLVDYKERLLKKLQDPEYAAEYLAQTLESGDQSAFLIALRDVVEAAGGIIAIAREASIQRQSLYKALSNHGNPRLTTLQGILKPLGLRLAITCETETR